MGDADIIGYITPNFYREGDADSPSTMNEATEPTGVFLQTTSHYSNVVSDQYTSYSNNAETQTPPDNTTHYASINDMYGNIRIKTPEDTYKPDKLSDKVTIDTLQQQRNTEIPKCQKTI
jgi:hypothetical protein